MATLDALPLPARPLATSAASARTGTRAVALWLLTLAGLIFAMAVIGAITRLTESGLSMVEWKPLIKLLPPLSHAEWERVFALYQTTPEYKAKNFWMGLEDFQYIFFWEWLHRAWGQLIGAAFLFPWLWFLARRRIPLPWSRPIAGMFLLLVAQGLMGAWMVESGLAEREDVSHYRLAAHLSLALILFGLCLFAGLRLLPRRAGAEADPETGRGAGWLLLPVALTVVWGAFVAGLNAGMVYTDFPLMDGRLLPVESFALQPLWQNAFDNTALVQALHRLLGMTTAGLVLWTAWRRVRAGAGALALPWRLTQAAVLLQVALGIATLWTADPTEGLSIPIATLHQAGALLIIACLVTISALSRPQKPLHQGKPLA